MDTNNTSMRTPLGRVRGLGSARSGTGHFWAQRMTAVANVPLSLFAVGIVVCILGKDYAAAKAVIANPLVTIGLVLFILSAVYHMKLGLQIVIEDYIHSEGRKILALMTNTFFAIAVGLSAVFALLKISFGG